LPKSKRLSVIPKIFNTLTKLVSEIFMVLTFFKSAALDSIFLSSLSNFLSALRLNCSYTLSYVSYFFSILVLRTALASEMFLLILRSTAPMLLIELSLTSSSYSYSSRLESNSLLFSTSVVELSLIVFNSAGSFSGSPPSLTT
jgi:hypothetical protein